VRAAIALIVGALLLSLLAVAAIFRGSSNSSGVPFIGKRQYVAENKRILEDVPLFPKSRLLYAQGPSEYHDSDEGENPLAPPKGWTNLRSYHPPDGTRMNDVLDFYDAKLVPQGWHPTGTYCGRGTYERDENLIVVNAGGVNPRDPTSSYDIAVDSHGADEC